MLPQLFQREVILAQFSTVTRELEQALARVPYSLLEITDEVQEQVCHVEYTIQLAFAEECGLNCLFELHACNALMNKNWHCSRTG